MRTIVFLIAIILTLQPAARAEEPFFKANDVIALVGGEDMVVAAELGYLETLIQLALPDHRLKFRSLAREGDTVFEQRRDLNYPKLEAQLDKMGATVVICQFGQMESLAAAAALDGMDRMDAMDKVDATKGASTVQEVHKVQAVHEKADAARKAKVAEFVAAYEKLIGRLKGKDGARRVVLIRDLKATDGSDSSTEAAKASNVFPDALQSLKQVAGVTLLDNHTLAGTNRWRSGDGNLQEDPQLALATAARFLATNTKLNWVNLTVEKDLLTLIAAKNRLWFHYYRPQNWAFLAGDRTHQPSSRDHLDPSKRWFPEELEKFVPLIDAKDAEIWALAAKLK